MKSASEIFTVEEVAKMLGVTPSSIYTRCRYAESNASYIRSKKFGSRAIFIEKQEVERITAKKK